MQSNRTERVADLPVDVGSEVIVEIARPSCPVSAPAGFLIDDMYSASSRDPFMASF